MKKYNTKNISFQIFFTILVSMLFVVVSITGYSTITMSSNEKNNINQNMEFITNHNNDILNNYFSNMLTAANGLASEVINITNLDYETAKPMLEQSISSILKNEHIFGSYTAFEPNMAFPDTPDGLSVYAYRNNGKIDVVSHNDYAEYKNGDYYTGSKNLKAVHITEPYEYKLDNGESVWLITLSVPLYKYNTFIGVANTDINLSSLDSIDMTSDLYKSALTLITTSQDTIVSISNKKNIVGQKFDLSNANPEILKAIQNGTPYNGTSVSQTSQRRIFIIVKPLKLEQTDLNWSILFMVDEKEAFAKTMKLTIILSSISLLGISVVIFFALAINKKLKPIKTLVDVAKNISEGHLDVEITYNKPNELGELAKYMKNMCFDLKSLVDDITYNLDQMAHGDFTVESRHREVYIGDYEPIIKSLDKIKSDLNYTLNNIEIGADEVQVGSNQIADSSTILSSGTIEQASAIELLSQNIQDISEEIANNAHHANIANNLSKENAQYVQESQALMKNMLTAMEDISNKSNEIGKIVKTIDDIAFQTNILALNAAVEAARAGVAGKGFAVVADEVRNLAQKSASAAKNTTKLIEETVSAVNNGTTITENTAKTFDHIVEKSKELGINIDEISNASDHQTSNINQILESIEQVNSVIQTNSATAEECAASAQELNSQATMLKNSVNQFILKK